MNIIFHVTSAVGVAVALSDTDRIKTSRDSVPIAVLAFIVGILIHGVLDYMPHQYPLSAAVDCLIGFCTIVLLTLYSNKDYRLIVFCSFMGSVFPDIIDLSPSIINKYLSLEIPTYQKVFPWHFAEYSGSIFKNERNVVSDVNHIIVLLVVFAICWCRRYDLKRLFK